MSLVRLHAITRFMAGDHFPQLQKDNPTTIRDNHHDARSFTNTMKAVPPPLVKMLADCVENDRKGKSEIVD